MIRRMLVITCEGCGIEVYEYKYGYLQLIRHRDAGTCHAARQAAKDAGWTRKCGLDGKYRDFCPSCTR